MRTSRLATALRALAFLPVLACGAASGAPVAANTSYIISLAGINVADLRITLKDDGERYDLALDADVTGLGQMVASGTAAVTSNGRSGTEALEPDAFTLKTVAGGQAFNVRVGFSGGDATEFVVTPPLLDNIDRVPVERSHLRGATDMLSAFVLKGGSLDENLCRRKLQIFTGVERFNVAMTFARTDEATSPRTGYQGPVVLCNIDYTPVSGHFTTSEITKFLAGSERILIWYAPLGESGYYIPYRVLMGTGFGDLSMVLTGLNY